MTAETPLLYSILIAFGIFLGILILCSILTLGKNYTHYRSTYDALLRGDYVYNEHLSKYGDIVYFRKPGDNSFNDDEILLFSNGSIKLLGKSAYIHNASFSYMDPYTVYWKIKIGNLIKQKKTINSNQQI